MELSKPGGLAKPGDPRWPNMFIFPQELRDAIPEYGGRALVFDAVSGKPSRNPAWFVQQPDPSRGEARANVRFLVHETGAFEGKFPLVLDIDAATLRALGKFFVELADQAETE